MQMSQFYHSVFTSGWISMNVSIVLDCQFFGSDWKACRINCYLTCGNGKEKNPCTYHLICLKTMGIWKSILVEEIDKTVSKIWREEMMRQES